MTGPQLGQAIDLGVGLAISPKNVLNAAGEWISGGSQLPDLIDTIYQSTLDIVKALCRTGSHNLTSDDPNLKVGPAGKGARGEVLPDATLPYIIFFENQSSASAPAQEVVIDDWLDPDLDWTTLRITEVSWGDQVVAAPVEGGAWTARTTVADYRTNAGRSWWVDVDARTDLSTGHVRWTLRTLDPQTEQPPEDPLAGFMPPNDASGRGQGYVAFTVRPKSGRPDGTPLTNKATIVFDVNQPIVTNEVANVIWRPHIYLPTVVRR